LFFEVAMMRRLQWRVKASPQRDRAARLRRLLITGNEQESHGIRSSKFPCRENPASSLDLGVGARIAGRPVVYELASHDKGTSLSTIDMIVSVIFKY
jgi:hypothetical protein